MSNLFEVGRLCLKIAGRDAGKKCLVLENIDANYVLVDGQTRRKNVNIKHLEPLETLVEINERASPSEVKAALKKLDIEVVEKKSKQVGAKPVRQRTVKEKKTESKANKKEAVKTEETEKKTVKAKKKEE